MLLAVTATLVGFAIEVGSGHRELGTVFAFCYVVGCLGAVLAVRHCSVFTAVIQPPLILFVAVPLAYFLMHGSELSGLKGFLITCGYPLIERFPLMLFTSAAVLLIGMMRWYFATAVREAAPVAADAEPSAGLLAGLAARWSAWRRPRHGIERPRTRPARPPRAERPSAPRGDAGRRQPARRPRPQAARTPEPPRRVPRERRDPYPARTRREAYPPYDQYQPRPRPRPAPRGIGTHHPVSRVRYRGSDPGYAEYPQYPQDPQYPDYPDYRAPRGR